MNYHKISKITHPELFYYLDIPGKHKRIYKGKKKMKYIDIRRIGNNLVWLNKTNLNKGGYGKNYLFCFIPE